MNIRRIGSILLLLTVAAAAGATERPGLSVRLLDFPQPARVGETISLRFEVTAHEAGFLGDLSFADQGWSVSAQKRPTAMALEKGARTIVEAQALCLRADEPVAVEIVWEGSIERYHFDLSPAAFARSQAPSALRLIEDSSAPRGRAGLVSPQPVPSSDDPRAIPFDVEIIDDDDMPDGSQKKVDRNIRVRGRVGYFRPDGELIGADGATIEVVDADNGPDETLATTITDDQGNFDVTFYWNPCSVFCDQEPDIVVRAELLNSEIRMEDTAGSLYSFASPTFGDYTGTDLQLFTLVPSNSGLYPAMHIQTNIVRIWRWLEFRGYDQSQVTGIWPDGIGSGAFYRSGSQEIHVTGGPDSPQWEERVSVHEYSHHFIHTHGLGGTFDYCNGYCDDDVSEGDCGHCLWCEENGQDAWNEGGPDWLGDTVVDEFGAEYGIPALSAYNFESLRLCNDDSALGDATITEGFFAALLLDIQDSTNDDDSDSPGYADQLSLGTNEILTVMTVDDPRSPLEFIADFRARYPQHDEDLWQTLQNNRYWNLDTIPPGAVPAVTSSSHSVGVDSPDATIRFTWNEATDNFSGIEGYALSITANAPSAPTPDVDVLPGLGAYVTPPLMPGFYFFNIRARDRSGRVGPVTSIGPYEIREALPANLVYDTNPGWYDHIVPRNVNDAGPTFLPAPTALDGNQQTTYWNLRVQNVGEVSTNCCPQVWAIADGQTFLTIPNPPDYFETIAGLGPNTADNVLNQGPLELRGGRHTFGAEIDFLGAVPESDETDNRRARQWVWSPQSLIPAADYVRNQPPDRDGSWEDVVGGGLYYNTDGLRFSSSGWWNAVYVAPSDYDDDFDARLHAASTGPEDGFANTLGYSSRGPGCLDAVFVNRNVTGSVEDWDVGVVQGQGNPHFGNYRARHVENQTLNFDTPLLTSFGSFEYLRIYEFYVDVANVGDVLLEVDVDPGAAPLYALWLAEDFATGDLLDYDAWGTQDADNRIQMIVNIPDSGYNALVLYRDPKNGGGSSSLPITVRARAVPTDFEPFLASGWYAPLVPRSAADGSFSSVPAPTLLVGNTSTTYLNWSTKNMTSASGTDFYQARAFVDGVFIVGSGLPSVAPNQHFWTNYATGIEVTGGRHSLALLADGLFNYAELSETNNGYGEQWIWSPKQMTLNSPLLRDQPAGRTGGWTEVTTGEPLWFNSDGLRTPTFSTPVNDNGWWAVVAVTPNASSDVDLRLHERSTGPKNGFDVGLGFSGQGAGETEVVVVNFNQTAFRGFDAGVIDIAGNDGYVAYVGSSFFLATNPEGSYGTFGMPGGRLAGLHDMWLDPGPLKIDLINQDGNIDYGMTLHRSDLAFQDLTTGVTDGTSYLGGPGENESMVVDIPTAGSYALMVYKRTSSGAMQQGLYDLNITRTVVAVDDGPSALVTGIGSIHPNPFNPRTTISMRLRERGPVTLDLYNLRGERVRRLVDGTRDAGEHRIVWDGRDYTGATVASGTYIVRMQAGDQRDVRKITLLK